MMKVQGKKRKKNQRQILAYDLGGTKLACAVIDEKGKILAQHRQSTDTSRGPQHLIQTMFDAGQALRKSFPKVQAVGIASAGPLDPQRGVLLNPTNLFTDGKHWGTVALKGELKRKLKLPVVVENDAAASALGERWKGKFKEKKDFAVLTLGTGLGTAFICNGQLVRSGRGLHTEGGHVLLHGGDSSAPCGCGNFGCAEAYLSGTHFTRRANERLSSSFSTEDLAQRARNNDKKILEFFREYSIFFAEAVSVYVVLFSPKTILLTGSFAKASDLFLADAHTHLKKLLGTRREGIDLLPTIQSSSLGNDSSLLGAAYSALTIDA